MTPELRGLQFRSNPENYVAGGAVTFKMDFLQQARYMTAPEVYEMDLIFTGTVGGVTATAQGRDAAKLFDNIRFKDSDDVFNLSGAGARILEQMEIGQKQIDPATVASGATNTTYNYRLRLLFAPPHRCVRPRDFAIPINNFLDGGEFTVSFPSAVPGFNVQQADWRVQLVAFVADGRVPELKARRRVKEEAVTQQEFDYQVNGFLRAAILTSKLATTGYTDLSAYTVMNSRTLKWPAAWQTLNLVDDYRFNTQAYASNDEFLLPSYGALGIMVPERDQKIGAMIDTKSLHIDLLAAAPAGGRLITDTVIDRNGDMAALQQGYGSPSDLAQAVQRHGVIVGAKKSYPLRGFNTSLARKLPIRIDIAE